MCSCVRAKQPVSHSAYKSCLILGTLYSILYHIANSVLIVVFACLLCDLLPPDSARVPWEVTEGKKIFNLARFNSGGSLNPGDQLFNYSPFNHTAAK